MLLSKTVPHELSNYEGIRLITINRIKLQNKGEDNYYFTKQKLTFQSEYIKVSFRSSTRVKTCGCSRGCKSGRSFSEVGSVKPFNHG